MVFNVIWRNLSKWFPILFIPLFISIYAEKSYAQHLTKLYDLTGKRDAVVLADHNGKILISINEKKKLIPASIIKLVTSLASIYYLGDDYRFKTEFYLDEDSNLKIKGFGDPLLISEVVKEISETLSQELDITGKKINDLVLDDSYFESPINIPGKMNSKEPYDASNGALCVNFNTINFLRTSEGEYVSAEQQTPLLNFALNKIRAAEHKKGRIVLFQREKDITIYSGHLFLHFLKKQGVMATGKIRIGEVFYKTDKLIFKYYSRYTIKQVISKLLEYSNNFIANQILLAAGAKYFAPPATLEKGLLALKFFAGDLLKTEDINIIEGSGISRKNRISASNMLKVLEAFEPYHHLMRRAGNEYYKTGTLNGIATRAGYIKNKSGNLYRYVVMINTPGRSPDKIMKIIRQIAGD